MARQEQIRFLKDRMFNKKDEEKYYEFTFNLYTQEIINDKIKDKKYLEERTSIDGYLRLYDDRDI